MCAVLMVYCWHDGENEKVTAEGEIQEASGKKKKKTELWFSARADHILLGKPVDSRVHFEPMMITWKQNFEYVLVDSLIYNSDL